jgi:hypothetical protein
MHQKLLQLLGLDQIDVGENAVVEAADPELPKHAT